MGKSRLTDIHTFLKSVGHDVYFPAQKKDEAKKPYIVVKDAGLSGQVGTSSTNRLYDLMVYVPVTNFTDLEPLVDKVCEDMKSMYPMIVNTNFQTPSFFDDDVNAWMVSIQFRNSKTALHHKQ